MTRIVGSTIVHLIARQVPREPLEPSQAARRNGVRCAEPKGQSSFGPNGDSDPRGRLESLSSPPKQRRSSGAAWEALVLLRRLSCFTEGVAVTLLSCCSPVSWTRCLESPSKQRRVPSPPDPPQRDPVRSRVVSLKQVRELQLTTRSSPTGSSSPPPPPTLAYLKVVVPVGASAGPEPDW